MGAYTVNRPEEAAMRRLLERNPDNAAGAILRLAWLQGLLREEITCLTWDQISFLNRKILLPGRAAPMEAEMEEYLQQMCGKWSRVSEYVVFSERFRKPMQPQAISRAARRELDSEGQTVVRLIDLRHDYVIRQLQAHSAPAPGAVSHRRVSALEDFTAPADRSFRISRKSPPLRKERGASPLRYLSAAMNATR